MSECTHICIYLCIYAQWAQPCIFHGSHGGWIFCTCAVSRAQSCLLSRGRPTASFPGSFSPADLPKALSFQRSAREHCRVPEHLHTVKPNVWLHLGPSISSFENSNPVTWLSWVLAHASSCLKRGKVSINFVKLFVPCRVLNLSLAQHRSQLRWCIFWIFFWL